MAVGGQLLLQWETYLLHILWNLCGKPKRGRQEAFFFFFFFLFFGLCFHCQWARAETKILC